MTVEPVTTSLTDVIAVVVTALGIEDRAAELDASTALFGEMPELDSLAVLDLVEGLQDRFGIEVEDEDINGDVFATMGSLTEYVDQRRAGD